MTHAGVTPALAATVVLLRPARSGLEVLLTRRPTSMAFAPDMHVFPGGRVDAGDGDPRLVERSILSPSEAAAGLGGDLPPDLAIATYIAAIREVFEECGVLLADVGGTRGAEVDGSPAISIGRFEAGDLAPPISEGRSSRDRHRSDARAISMARSALVGGDADLATIAMELDLILRTDLLVPLSRWVTPPILPRRFDARFFAAALPTGARVTFEGDEVAGHAWMTPAAALAAMADDTLAMWIPTSGTLQQLVRAGSIGEIRDRLAPSRLAEPTVEVVSPDVTRIVMPAGGGVAGQPIASYLVGRARFVVVDPGDPTGPGLELAMAIAAERGGTIEAIALTQVAPDHAGGAEGLAEILGIPILAGPGGGRVLPFEVLELSAFEATAATQVVPFGDVPLLAVHTPGPVPEHLAFAVGEGLVIAGDLDGIAGARSIVAPADVAATERSRVLLAEPFPVAAWLPAHPAPESA